MIYDRESKTVNEDSQYGGKYLNFLYNKAFGRILLKLIISPVFSKINGKYNSMRISKKKIKKFINEYNIGINEYEEKEYKSFNEFFIRKKKKTEYDKEKYSFISPADSKLTVYKIEDDLTIKVKQSMYTIEDLIQDKLDLDQFKNGNCLVFRLSMDNYHRYCYVDDGKIESTKRIKGKLHTVSSISNKHKVYSQNTRVCSYINTENFGKIICIEVGALTVGKINNRDEINCKKGEEKGYFELGGSTIIILTNDKVKIDNDILEYSNQGIETKVKYGERIGKVRC